MIVSCNPIPCNGSHCSHHQKSRYSHAPSITRRIGAAAATSPITSAADLRSRRSASTISWITRHIPRRINSFTSNSLPILIHNGIIGAPRGRGNQLSGRIQIRCNPVLNQRRRGGIREDVCAVEIRVRICCRTGRGTDRGLGCPHCDGGDFCVLRL